MTAAKVFPRAANGAITCEINRTAVYLETVRLTRVPALGDCWELAFQSRLDTARNPEAEALRYQTFVSRESLEALRDAIAAALERPVGGA
jgi:hypothetical protein